ncbi:MAG: TonB-dependent receptor plug domain-containing protein [Dysgonamonadaceae bacterium]|jgi:hypothetical protein|nr:TonB-dependent receptor plug domain-containing protein [Dysgonamonadaceae bacterium]
MKKITLLMLFFAAILTATAQNNNFVEGQILNDGSPARGIDIKTAFSNSTTKTDRHGNFSIRNIQPQRDTLVIVFDEERTLEIALDGDNFFYINMRNDSVFLERDRIRVLTPSFGGTIVSRGELGRGGETNLLRAISHRVAGVRFVRGNLQIRGSHRPPLYVIDGVRTFNASHLGVWDVESVEVVKGPTSMSMFGRDGIAGVVVITLRTTI